MPPRFSRPLRDPVVFASHLDFQTRVSPCEAACPAGMPIRKMNRQLAEGEAAQALRFVRAVNPFSAVTGRVCSHPCEAACNRERFDQVLSIRALERFAFEKAQPAGAAAPARRERSGKRLAIVGAGPAGMTAAWFSALFGHEVTVFEAASLAGGMPRIGIPDFRLPKRVVECEIGRILALGVTVKTNTVVGRDVLLDELLAQFDACLIAAGAWKERLLEVPGAHLALPAMALLRRAKLGERPPIGSRVVIVGGGGVAFDCALTARRLGATEVHVVCVEKPGQMRATQEEIRQAAEEGISILNGHTVARISGETPGSLGVELFEIAEFRFDDAGRLRFEARPARSRRLAVDCVIAAIGMEPDLTLIDPNARLRRTARGTIAVDAETLETSIERVFAAGDVVSGPSTVAHAVGSGRLAAVRLHERLSGVEQCEGVRFAIGADGSIVRRTWPRATPLHVVKYEEMLNLEFYARQARRESLRLAAPGRIASFDEIEAGYGTADALAEARRCFQCGQCRSCGKCVEDCPGYVLTMAEHGPEVAHPDECWHCGNCRISCPSAAVAYEFPLSMLV